MKPGRYSTVIVAGMVAGLTLGYAGFEETTPAEETTIQAFDALVAGRICTARPAAMQSAAAVVPVAQPIVDTPAKPHDHAPATAMPAAMRKVLHYRNPMGEPDISPVPKKDQMGMDYIPVYEGEGGDGKSIHLSPQRIQLSGVRTEVVEARVLVQPIRGSGTIKYDERRLTAVTVGVEGFVDELYVKHVGQAVRAGEPLFRMSSNNPQMLQIEIARRTRGRSDTSSAGLFTGLSGTSATDWPSPATGIVIEKRLIPGQRIGMADEVLRIADMSSMWVIADVAEMDLPGIKPGLRAIVRPRAYLGQAIEGTVLFIYPELRAETRTVRVAIEVPNPTGRLKAEMYADVELRVGADGDPVVSVPDSALIRDGINTRVLVATGAGHFEPRAVKVGMHGAGYTQVLDGVDEGEAVVTTAAFLIDSEANLQAALAAFRRPEAAR